MTDHVKNIKEALAMGPTSALFTHPRDDNKWKENEAFALACNPEAITALLGELEAKDAALLKVARMAEALKKDCGMCPETPQAIRNGEYMNISYVARAAIKGATP